MQSIYDLLISVTPDTFNKVVIAIVATIVMIIQGVMAYLNLRGQEKIAARQVAMQADIAKNQLNMQKGIAERQAIDNVSSKRQQWIDELRKDLAEQLALLPRIVELGRPNAGISAADKQKIFDEMAAALLRTNELAHLIRLRLNPTEREHIDLLQKLKELAELSGPAPVNETVQQRANLKKSFFESREEVIQLAQVVLKKEWERVKNGKM